MGVPDAQDQEGLARCAFPAWLYDELKRYEALVESRRLAAGSEWKDYGLAFPSRTGVPINVETLCRSRFKPLLKRAGLEAHFTLYSLRYTFATLQYLAGERDRVISDLMRHVRTDFSKEVYVRVLPQMREAASDSLERLLFGAVRATSTQSVTEQVM